MAIHESYPSTDAPAELFVPRGRRISRRRDRRVKHPRPRGRNVLQSCESWISAGSRVTTLHFRGAWRVRKRYTPIPRRSSCAHTPRRARSYSSPLDVLTREGVNVNGIVEFFVVRRELGAADIRRAQYNPETRENAAEHGRSDQSRYDTACLRSTRPPDAMDHEAAGSSIESEASEGSA